MGKIVVPKVPFRRKNIRALQAQLLIEHRVRELALFNLDIDSKLRDFYLVTLKVSEMRHGSQVATRAIVM